MSATAMALALAVALGHPAPAPAQPAAPIVGPDSVWASAVRIYAPAPTGTPISVAVSSDLMVDGQQAGGSWDGSSVVMSDENSVTLEHELGHAYDDRDLTDHWRGVLEVDLGVTGPWQNQDRYSGDIYCEHITCPNELFADARAGCALRLSLSTSAGHTPRRYQRVIAWWSGYGLKLSPGRYRRFCTDLSASAL